MAQVLDDREFRMGTQFLSEEEEAVKINKAVGRGFVWRSEADVKLSLPKREFPYEFGFRSEISSPVDSLDTTESDEEEFFAELAQRLTLAESRKFPTRDVYKQHEFPKVSGGSPQSILGGIGGNGRQQGLSPPAWPYESEYDTWCLIRAATAAGEVERMKVSAGVSLKTSPNGQFREMPNPKPELSHLSQLQNYPSSFFADQQIKDSYISAARQTPNAALLCDHHLQNLARSGRFTNSRCGVPSELLTQSVWSPLQRPPPRQPPAPARVQIQAAPLQRKESVGTGVFLPRRYNAAPAAPPRKRNVSNALVPTKVVQALNMSVAEMNGRSHPHYSANASSMSLQNYEALVARRNAFLSQQQRRVAEADDLARSNLEVCLPQEWSY